MRLIKTEAYTEALDVARDQVEGGAQIVDINMDEGMLDSKQAMIHFVNPSQASQISAVCPS